MAEERVLNHLVENINDTIDKLQERIRAQGHEIESLRQTLSDKGGETDGLRDELAHITEKLRELNTCLEAEIAADAQTPTCNPDQGPELAPPVETEASEHPTDESEQAEGLDVPAQHPAPIAQTPTDQADQAQTPITVEEEAGTEGIAPDTAPDPAPEVSPPVQEEEAETPTPAEMPDEAQEIDLPEEDPSADQQSPTSDLDRETPEGRTG